MGQQPFSIDSNLCKTEISKIQSDLDGVQSELDDIYRRALLNDNMPIAQIIVEQLGASPKELKMLSKVFDRLAVKVALRNDLREKLGALQFIGEKESWLYEKIGAPDRDIEHFLASTFTSETEPSS
jgi:hypothetical protein